MSLQLFNFNDHNVRVVMVDGEPWWIAKDICSVLEIKDPSTAVSSLDDDESGTATIGTSGQNRDMATVSESGLYSLVLRSRKPQAKAFKKWLTSMVIPSIRKTGSYNAPKSFDRSTLPRPMFGWPTLPPLLSTFNLTLKTLVEYLKASDPEGTVTFLLGAISKEGGKRWVLKLDNDDVILP